MKGVETRRRKEWTKALEKAFIVEWTRQDAPPLIDVHFKTREHAKKFTSLLNKIMPQCKYPGISNYTELGYGCAGDALTVALQPTKEQYEILKIWFAAAPEPNHHEIPSVYDISNVTIPGAIVQIDRKQISLAISVDQYKKLSNEDRLLFKPKKRECIAPQPAASRALVDYSEKFNNILEKFEGWLEKPLSRPR